MPTGPIRRRTSLNEILSLPYDEVIFEALAAEDLIRLVGQYKASNYACCALSELSLRQHPAALELAGDILQQGLGDCSLKEQALAVLCERDPAQAFHYLLQKDSEPGLYETLVDSLDLESLRGRPELWSPALQLAGRMRQFDIQHFSLPQKIEDFISQF